MSNCKVTRLKNRWFWPKLGVSGLQLQLEFTDGYEMMHRAWSSMEEVPYCFSRSYVKFQGHTALKIVDFDPNWAFADCNSSLESPMATKWCTELETAKKRCPIVFQGHPSNSKVTRDKTSRILTQIRRFRTIGRSQLSNPSDLPCFIILNYIFPNKTETLSYFMAYILAHIMFTWVSSYLSWKYVAANLRPPRRHIKLPLVGVWQLSWRGMESTGALL